MRLGHNEINSIYRRTNEINELVGIVFYTTARRSYIHKTYVHSTNEKIRTSLILHQEPRFIVRIFLQLKYVCPSLF